MTHVLLRPLRSGDLAQLHTPESDDLFEFFGFAATNGVERRFAADGLLTEDVGVLAVEDADRVVVGTVSWFAVRHGPTSTARALNVGISLHPAHRGRGLGTAAQAKLAQYLFAHTLIERVEAATDVENTAEQRALEKAGFTREGMLRHAQFRHGEWHDLVMYSRLRGDL